MTCWTSDEVGCALSRDAELSYLARFHDTVYRLQSLGRSPRLSYDEEHNLFGVKSPGLFAERTCVLHFPLDT